MNAKASAKPARLINASAKAFLHYAEDRRQSPAMTTLSYVAHHALGDNPSPQLMSASESMAVKRWWSGDATRAESSALEAVFRRCKVGRLWLACHCQGGEPLPLLAVFRRDDKLYLRRMTERGQHARACAFYQEQIAPHNSMRQSSDTDWLSDVDSDLTGVVPPPRKPPSFYILPSPIGETEVERCAPNAGARPDHGHRERDGASCARQLKWLLHAAALHRFPQGSNPLGACLDVAKATAVGPHFLSRYLYFKPSAVTHRVIARAAQAALDDGLDDCAYLMTVVQRIDDALAQQQLRCSYHGEEAVLVAASGTVKVFGQRVETRYPLLTLIKLDRNQTVIDGYAHPIYTPTCWALVDSEYERQTLDLLCQAARRVTAGGGLIAIEKPLFEWRETGFLPDFVIEFTKNSSTRYLVVETMGSDDVAYRERKARLREQLSFAYDYVEHDFLLPENQRMDIVQAVLDFCL